MPWEARSKWPHPMGRASRCGCDSATEHRVCRTERSPGDPGATGRGPIDVPYRRSAFAPARRGHRSGRGGRSGRRTGAHGACDPARRGRGGHRMPGQDGISAALELRLRLPSCRTLILTMYGRPGFVQRAMLGGLAGFVLKDAPVETLAEAIRRCAAGENVVDPELATRVLRAGSSPLSNREQTILIACAEGLSTAELASRLWLTEGSVRNRVSEILGKLGVRTRAEAVQIARDNGWL